MSTSTATLGGRIDPSPTTLKVALGDVLLIAVFIVVGEFSHGVSVLERPLWVLGTAIPFYVGWALVAPLVGVYGRRAREQPWLAALLTAGAWTGAALVGQLLRGTDLFHGNLALPFVVVSIAVGLALLVPWRVAVSVRA
ncbi:DUF3054 domain-containing protein [Halomarina litorea]|uniref:DUF3054 domain-containing protein n=1 Tax=Halomarina litorea TaxID=2961595 RepID=UPI0020C3F691|nr:DUF3054 domain-containing protein [Halomarina sp. BCD28]